MNKKGFTLVELLAVIVILAIIAVIATPMILNVIDNAKKGASENSALGYIEGIEKYIVLNEVTNKNSFNFEKGLGYKVEDIKDYVEVKGDKTTEGWVCIGDKKEVEKAKLKINNYVVKYENNKATVVDEEVGDMDCTESEVNNPVTYTEYKIGQEIVINGEQFYVIEDSDIKNNKVTVMTKENIDTTNLVQSSSANTIAFSSSNYWQNESTKYDLIEVGEPSSDHYAAYYAYKYGEKIGGTGRLMTYNEAMALKATYSNILYGNNLIYWLGTAYSANSLWGIDGKSSTERYGYGFGDIAALGVRPVITIEKDKIS